MTLLSLMIVTAAVFGWINHRYLKLPTTVGVMLVALGMSLGLLAMDAVGLGVREPVVAWLARVDFEAATLDVILAFLLFASALHVKLDRLFGQKWVIGLLASVGLLFSTAVIGLLVWLVGRALELPITPLAALLFGALISPTDPIAVIGILKSAGAPKSLETKIAGESLFNDGVGVVVFTILAAFVSGEHAPDAGSVTLLFLQEVPGSLALGWLAGWVAYAMLRSIDDERIEVMITLALAMGVYSLAVALHASGPLAVVVAGLFIGNTGRRYALSESVAHHLDTFWELVDEILNIVLFVLIGMEVLLLSFTGKHLALGIVAIPIVLGTRLVGVGGVVALLRRRRTFTPHAVKIMTWGGLRGGISIALALSIPVELASRDLLVSATYVVVIFSIVVQGLTVRRLVGWIPDASEG